MVTRKFDALETAWSTVIRLSLRPAPRWVEPSAVETSDTGPPPRADDPRRGARDDGAGRHVARHHRVRTDRGTLAHGRTAQDRGVGADRDAVADRGVRRVRVGLVLVEGLDPERDPAG